MKPPTSRASDLWFEFVTDDHHCGLCGNHGFITTRVQTPAGHWTGIDRRFCICPNGRAIKKQTEKAL